ncbi:MAG: M23 family metallopeptidase [Gemmatimonadetes bacterium]|nr:M23 family metallopeptidase [Gemmatimonadota bacterium]
MISRGALVLLMVAAAGCSIPRWPAEGPVTSPFGVRWSGMRPDIHRGVDIGVPRGTPVRPMAPGRVTYAGVMSGYGNVVWVDHGGEVVTLYAHLDEIRVRPGEAVDRQAVLGLSGSSGDVTGAHLHFEVLRWGREVDPVPLLGGPPGP